MGKIIEYKINNFGGGISDDPRQNTSNGFAMARHFDISNPYKLRPLHGTTANETKDLGIKKFVYAPFGASAYRLFGYGVKAGAGSYPAVYMNEMDGTAWATPINNESNVNVRNTDVFFYYKNYIYMWAGGIAGGTLVRFDSVGLGAFDNTFFSPVGGYTTVAQPVHHKADDVAYFFHNNKVHSLNGASWTADVLTLPNNMYIVSACAVGNYLAITCNPNSSLTGNPVTFLWDRDSSLTTLNERIDMGEGSVVCIANLEGTLVAVMNFFTNSSYGLYQGKLLIKRINGSFAETIKTFPIDNQSTLIYNTSIVKDNKLYFPAKLINDGDTNMGIYAVDRLGRVNLEVIDTDATSYEGIYATANMWWLAHSADGSVNRTVIDSTFDTTSAYESQKINAGDSSALKKLIGVTTMFDPLPSAGSIKLYYRKDESTSWTELFTYTTDNAISHSCINKESDGTQLPEFRELQIKIESTGGAIITGFKIKTEILDKDLY